MKPESSLSNEQQLATCPNRQLSHGCKTVQLVNLSKQGEGTIYKEISSAALQKQKIIIKLPSLVRRKIWKLPFNEFGNDVVIKAGSKEISECHF